MPGCGPSSTCTPVGGSGSPTEIRILQSVARGFITNKSRVKLELNEISI